MNLVIVVGTLAQDPQAEIDLGERANGERADDHKKKAADVVRQPPSYALGSAFSAV